MWDNTEGFCGWIALEDVEQLESVRKVLVSYRVPIEAPHRDDLQPFCAMAPTSQAPNAASDKAVLAASDPPKAASDKKATNNNASDHESTLGTRNPCHDLVPGLVAESHAVVATWSVTVHRSFLLLACSMGARLSSIKTPHRPPLGT